MRAFMLSVAALIGLGFIGNAQSRANDGWPGYWRWQGPPASQGYFGYSPYNSFQYRGPRSQDLNYAMPQYTREAPAYGYAPYSSYNYRITPPRSGFGYRVPYMQ